MLPGAVAPGDRMAIVGAGPVGLAALQTAALASPAAVFVLDISDTRLQVRARAYPTLAPAALAAPMAVFVLDISDARLQVRARFYPTLAPANRCLLLQHTGGPRSNPRGPVFMA